MACLLNHAGWQTGIYDSKRGIGGGGDGGGRYVKADVTGWSQPLQVLLVAGN
jgi:hypothetical protein